MNDPVLIKIGGAFVESSTDLESFMNSILHTAEQGANLVLVHGGGAEINRNLELIEEPAEFVRGLRVTGERAAGMVEMTLSGSVNKKLVGLYNRLRRGKEPRAVGLSGVDGETFICGPKDPALGRVGRIETVGTGLIALLLNNHWLPIVSPISMGKDGLHYNVNADEAAAALAGALKVSRLMYVSDVPGVLDENKKILPRLTRKDIEKYMEQGTINGGMIPKLNSCLEVLAAGVGSVNICGWTDAESFQKHLTGQSPLGTTVVLD